MLIRAYFDAHHRYKWQCFRIRLVDKVMKIDFSYDFAIANNPKLFEEKFIQKIIDFAKEFNIELKDSNKDFNEYLKNFCESAQERSLVLLIDEYDYHLSQNIENPQLFSDYAAVLRIFYSVLKNQLSKFRCIFITGITRYKDSSIFTAMSPTVVVGQKFLCKHVGMASGFTIGLSMSFGGLVSPLMGKLGDIYGIEYTMYGVAVFIALAAIGTLFIPKVEK